MLLNELFDKPLSHEEIKDTNRAGLPTDNHQFKVNGKLYNVQIFKIDDFRQAGLNLSEPGIGISFQNLSEPDNTEGITNTGDAIKVFSTVIDIIKSAIKKYDPVLIAFGAHEKSRQKLYNKIIRTMKSKYGYETINNYDTSFELNGSEYYVLKKSNI